MKQTMTPKERWLAGVENAHFLQMDHPSEVEAFLAAMHDVLLAKTRVLCDYSPADVFYMIENAMDPIGQRRSSRRSRPI